MKIIISAGGTLGHINPALSIIEKLEKEEKSLDVLYIGTHNRMEKDIIPKNNINYESLEIYGLSKTNMVRNVKNVVLIKKAYKRCLEIMKEYKPDLVIGTGGYVTYPVIMAAKKLGIKIFLHEQNSIPGKANKMLSKNVDLVGISFKSSEMYFKNVKEVFYSGNPCASHAVLADEISKESIGLSKNKKLILIVGGSLGSEALNKRIKTFLNLVDDEEYEVLFITGKNHYDELSKENFPENVVLKPFIDLVGIMKNTDLIISRAGASTISEILALKIPSILIPSPYVANNHQYFNALDLSNQGLAVLLEEKGLTSEKLQITINDLLYNEKKLNNMKSNLNKFNEETSADLIYNKLKELLNDK